MVDGPTEATDHERTEANRGTVRSFVEEVLVKGGLDKLGHYVDGEGFTQHNPHIADGLAAWRSVLETRAINYERNHRLLAEGNFVLAVSEGYLDGVHSSFYDLFRAAEGMLVEHWDTIEAVPARDEWKNDNGKF